MKVYWVKSNVPPSLEVKILQISKLSSGFFCYIALKYVYHSKYNKKYLSKWEKWNEIFCGKYTGELKAMTCLVHAEAYQKLLVTVHSKDGSRCHVSPSEVQIQHFSVDHNVSVLMEKSHWQSVCKISVFITVLSKHSFLQLRSVFLGSGLRLPTWFHFVRFFIDFFFSDQWRCTFFFFFSLLKQFSHLSLLSLLSLQEKFQTTWPRYLLDEIKEQNKFPKHLWCIPCAKCITLMETEFN